MSATPEIAALARQIINEVRAALEAGEDLRREKRGIGVRLRSLLTMTDPSSGAVRQARLTVLTAIGRTEIGDQIRRSGGCHTGAERAVELLKDTDFEMLADGLRQFADFSDGSR
ncbi:MAG: hypothetical protein KAY37_11265 [Phycisphaerae bacterium]|nr:hypothetical protein [Phycisphaerae bacterium]